MNEDTNELDGRAFRALLDAHNEVQDFSEWLTRVVAGVTATVGGIDELIAGRPGSWESTRIEEWMRSAGCEESDVLRRLRDEWHDYARGGQG